MRRLLNWLFSLAVLATPCFAYQRDCVEKLVDLPYKGAVALSIEDRKELLTRGVTHQQMEQLFGPSFLLPETEVLSLTATPDAQLLFDTLRTNLHTTLDTNAPRQTYFAKWVARISTVITGLAVAASGGMMSTGFTTHDILLPSAVAAMSGIVAAGAHLLWWDEKRTEEYLRQPLTQTEIEGELIRHYRYWESQQPGLYQTRWAFWNTELANFAVRPARLRIASFNLNGPMTLIISEKEIETTP